MSKESRDLINYINLKDYDSENDGIIYVINKILSLQLDSDYESIDSLFENLDIINIPRDMLLTLLKYTFNIRYSLPNWYIFLKSVDKEMKKRKMIDNISFITLFEEETEYCKVIIDADYDKDRKDI